MNISKFTFIVAVLSTVFVISCAEEVVREVEVIKQVEVIKEVPVSGDTVIQVEEKIITVKKFLNKWNESLFFPKVHCELSIKEHAIPNIYPMIFDKISPPPK